MVKGATGFTLRLVCLTAYNVPEHNIFNPLFYRISSTFKPIQEIQYTIDGVVFRPHSYYFRRARKDYREWLNFLIPSAAACTRNWIGSIDRGLSILNYRYTVETGSRCVDLLLLRTSVPGGTRERPY